MKPTYAGRGIMALTLTLASMGGWVATAEPPQPAPSEEKPQPGAEQPAGPATPPSAPERSMKYVNLFVEEWRWTPDTIRVKKGQHVVLQIESMEGKHAFFLKAYNLDVPLEEGHRVKVEFDADKVGKFPWKCSRPCGDGCAKLRGTLVVEE